MKAFICLFVLVGIVQLSQCAMPQIRKRVPETHSLRIGFPLINIKRQIGMFFHRPTFTITWPEKLGNKPPFGWVTIDSNGWLVVAHHFDYEALPENNKIISFVVTAKNGKPSRYERRRRHYGRRSERKAKVIIEVVDENDELPLLEAPPGGLVYVAADAAPGATVYTLKAHDADETARLRYSIRGDSACSRNFVVDEITGEISVTQAAGGITSQYDQCIIEVEVKDEDSCSRTQGCQMDTDVLRMVLGTRDNDDRILYSRGITSYYSPEDDVTVENNAIFGDNNCPPFTQPDPLDPDSCIEIPPECIPNPCENRGVCTLGNHASSEKKYFCRCVPGWEGEHCQIKPKPVQIYRLPEEENNTVVEVPAHGRPEETVYPTKTPEECKALEHQCRASASAELCSGNGECRCGECWCITNEQGWSHWNGNFCECNDWSCPKVEGRMCGGHGTCECGKCVCHKGWGGEACDCRTSDALCYPPRGGEKCSGRGVCRCGSCQCEAGFAGSACHCEKQSLSPFSMVLCRASDIRV